MLINLPVQSAPVVRSLTNHSGQTSASGTGVVAAAQTATACDGLTGLAEQMCYAVMYGVS